MAAGLRGRVAVVTGAGRCQGIGAAICKALAEEGADVFFTHWKEGNEPKGLLQELRCAGVRAETKEVDLSLLESPERLLDMVAARLGPPWVLVNNAAYSTRDGYEALDAATLDAHYAVNLRATALLSVGFARRFGGGSGGRIVNLTSGQSLGPMPGELAYAATKGAIEAFTRTLATEVGQKGRAKAGALGQVSHRQGRRTRGRGAARGVPRERGGCLDHGSSNPLRGRFPSLLNGTPLWVNMSKPWSQPEVS
jgi:3-oxoacyl-[acyl-carrier protein] reductase